MESITEEGFRLKMVMEEFRVFPDVFTYYSALIDGLCKECRLDDANLFFSEMCDRGWVPNGVTFITLINGQCKSGRVDLALEIYQQMVTKALKADLVLYNTLVNGFCKGGYFRESRKLVGEMTKRGLRPDKFMYTPLLDGGKAADFGWRIHIFRDGNGSRSRNSLFLVLNSHTARILHYLLRRSLVLLLSSPSKCSNITGLDFLITALRKWSDLVDCLTLKTKRSSQVQ
ncbi:PENTATRICOPEPTIDE REPEAT-CONTAINING PROTEIN-RELATED, partial [Salix koriyanagi]